MHYKAAQAGAWVEFDGVSESALEWHIDCVLAMKKANLLNRTLVSHDAGWYQPGESGAGKYRGYTTLFREFLPRLRQSGFSDAEVEQLLVKNPRSALTGMYPHP
jgi:phosphotriesterase-related protein